MSNFTPACRYCGQVIMMKNEYPNEESAVEAATRLCNCDEAKEYQRDHRFIDPDVRETKIADAKKEIDKDFRDFSLDTKALLYNVAVMVYDEEITKAALDLSSGTKVTIEKITSKGRDDISIKRTDSTVSVVEV